MKNKILIVTSILILITTCISELQGQIKSVPNDFNLDFEAIENGMPIGWQANGSEGYSLFIDSTIAKSGKYSVAIELKKGTPQFGVWGLIIPKNYEGEEITLSGYIKTENVTNGYASLLMRIDPQIAVDEIKITGTTEWKKYEVSMRMEPSKTKNFAIGAMLTGMGKVWFDNLEILIDGKNINELKPIEQNIFIAEKDHEFDNGSNIKIERLSNNQIRDLYILGLIWGFLKYYHPNIAKGNYNWDYELFRILPNILNSKNRTERDATLVRWMDNLGEFSKSINEENIDSNLGIKIKPDLDWIDNSGFTEKLSSLLMNIKYANRTGENYYVGLLPAGNPEFKNENSYKNKIYPDVGFRLLALYRYWNIIQYYYPYKYSLKNDWKNVLKEFIPKIVSAKNEIEYTLTILELIGRINDSHANIGGYNRVLIDYFGKYHAPIISQYIENKLIITGYYDEKLGRETGMEVGDILTKVDDVLVADIIKHESKYTPASNHLTQLRDIARNLLRTNDSVINIEFIRNCKIQKKEIKVYTDNELHLNSKSISKDTCFKMINKEIAYINNGSLKIEYLSKIWEELQHAKGLIIDNRNYPSDHPGFVLCSYLMPDVIPFFKISQGSIITPGIFIIGKAISIGRKNENYYKGKIIILVNENTQSSAETHTMAYKVHPNAMIIGIPTAGANGDISLFSLPGGISGMISGNGVYYPDGEETQRIGIIPDIIVKPTILGIREGRDELVEKAVEILMGKLKRD